MAAKNKSTNPGRLEPSGDREPAKLAPDAQVQAIIKVRREGYVPAGVRVRSRIDGEMFTGEFQAGALERIESDENVVSVAPSRRLRFID